MVLNKWGLVCAWGADTVNAHDSTFHPLVTRCAARMVVFADTTFGRKEGNPSNMKVCARGTWNDRMLIETTFSMLTQICHSKKAGLCATLDDAGRGRGGRCYVRRGRRGLGGDEDGRKRLRAAASHSGASGVSSQPSAASAR